MECVNCDLPKILRKLCISSKVPHQEIRWNFGILRSGATLQGMLKGWMFKACSKVKLLCNFVEITLRHRRFPGTLLHVFRTALYKNTTGGLLLIFNWSKEKRNDFKMFNDNHKRKLCFSQISTIIDWNRSLVASDLFHMFHTVPLTVSGRRFMFLIG